MSLADRMFNDFVAQHLIGLGSEHDILHCDTRQSHGGLMKLRDTSVVSSRMPDRIECWTGPFVRAGVGLKSVKMFRAGI